MMIPNLPTAPELARKFAELLAAEITSAQWREMCETNATLPGDDGSCASHDYCDANMVMQDAIYTLTYGPDADPDDDADMLLIHDDEALRVWAHAWHLFFLATRPGGKWTTRRAAMAGDTLAAAMWNVADVADLESQDFHDALAVVQHHIDVTDGGYAGIRFQMDGVTTEGWAQWSTVERHECVRDYVSDELINRGGAFCETMELTADVLPDEGPCPNCGEREDITITGHDVAALRRGVDRFCMCCAHEYAAVSVRGTN